jgi:flotillin
MNKSGSLTFFLVVTLIAGVALFVGGLSIPGLPDLSKVVLIGFGAVVTLVAGILVVITRLYRKTAADEAFVKTGVGGRRCIIDGGAIVIPVVHEVIPVSLRTFKLQIDRTGPEALITADFLRADVKAVFYIRVQKEEKAIEQAATSLGAISGDAHFVQNLIQEKLVSALRTVAATQTLHALNAKRAEFAEAVQKIVAEDLKPNGLTLESVTISSLDQAPLESMRPQENVFDAEGARTIAEKVQSQRVARNTIQREADQKVKEQDVRTAQYVAQQDVVEAKARADSEGEIAANRALAEQRAKTVAAEQARLAGIAQVESERQIELARVEQNRSIEVANQQREQSKEVAGVEKQKAVELARRAQQIAIAQAEKNRADAEALQLSAQREREAASQQVKTVEVKLTAERDKEKAVIAKQAEVEQQKIARQMDADVAAYAQIKKAEAEQTSADKQAKARVALAEAARQAKSLEAEGDQAVQMVPVNVAREQVNVEDARVTVKIRDLEGQSKFESIARELQVQLATIQAEKEAKIAAAKAMGEAMAKANLNIWGDPSAVERMTGAFFQGQAIGAFSQGISNSLPPGVVEMLGKLAGGIMPDGNGAKHTDDIAGETEPEIEVSLKPEPLPRTEQGKRVEPGKKGRV